MKEIGKKILGLDIGIASIGWALIEDKENRDVTIIDMGVRIVPTGEHGKKFSEGSTAGLSAERTQKRGIRRGYQRKKLRKYNLEKTLKNVSMYPDESLMHTDTLTLWELRAKAAKQPISLQELGRVFIHINHKRGFKSNRKAIDKEDQKTAFKDKLNQSEEFLEGRTIGQAFYDEFKKYYDAPNTERGSLPKVKNSPFKRQKYEEEFERIWKIQSRTHTQLDDKLKHEIKDQCIFYQRPLKSKKNELSKCEFEPNNRVIPKSSPFFQSFRIWQKINDITIIDDEGREFKLTEKDKQKLVTFLDTQEGTGTDDEQGIKVDKVLDVLGYTPTKKYSIKKFQKLPTNRTKARIIAAFEQANITNKKLLEFDPFSENAEDSDYYKLWHLLYSVEVTGNSTHLRDALMKKFNLLENQVDALIGINLEEGYGRLSAKAIKKILNYLKQGYDYYYSCEKIEADLETKAQQTGKPRGKSNYKNPASRTKEEVKSTKLKDKLSEVKKNELRNPVVEKILNQLVNLVNEIIETYGNPDEVNVELARDLKKSQKQRAKKDEKNKKNETERKNAIKEIKKYCPWMNHVSKKDIQRYLLWKESNGFSLYTGKSIKVCDLFSDDRKYDIDHIIPKARLFDDSYLNRTLCESYINEEKSDSTAEDYIKNRFGLEHHRQYIQRIKACKTMSPQKKKYLRMTAEEIPDDFINQHLANTRYISRETLKRLKQICHKVRPTTGQLTSHLRNIWKLNEVMYDTFRKPDDTSKKPNKRIDHRHHAVDALVVACTTDAIIFKLNTLNAREVRKSRAWDVEPPWNNIKQDTKKALENILISFKHRKRLGTMQVNNIKHSDKNHKPQKVFTPRGKLHDETIRGSIKWYERRNIFDALEVIDTIQNKAIRTDLQQILDDHDGDIKSAKKFLKKNLPSSINEASDNVTCIVTKYTKRIDLVKEMTDTKKSTSAKNTIIKNIIDKTIRKKVQERIASYDGSHIKAFTNYIENPIYHDKLKQIPIFKIKIIDNITAIAIRPIHDHNGEPILNQEGKPIYGNFARPDNNYTIAIYSNEKGKLTFKKISFWEAIQRKNKGILVINPKPHKGWELITTLHKGEMFIFPKGNDEIDENFILNSNNYSTISKHLYRVQKLSSSGDTPKLNFRHHLATTLNDPNTEIFIQSLKHLYGAFKVSINRLGMITDAQKII